MTPEVQVAQAMIDFLAFFLAGFIVFVIVDWLTGLFRRD